MNDRLLMLQMKNDNWEAVEAMDNWLWVFDHMPKRMKIVVDFKTQGIPNKAIARMCNCTVKNIEKHLRKAKKRLLRGEKVT